MGYHKDKEVRRQESSRLQPGRVTINYGICSECPATLSRDEKLSLNGVCARCFEEGVRGEPDESSN